MAQSPDATASWQQARQVVLARDRHCCRQCGTTTDLHIHHRIPRALGGTDEPANLITLCAGCHATYHPQLQMSLARRIIERWGLRVARLLDHAGTLPDTTRALGLALRLFGKERFREGQLDIVLAALRGESMLVVRPTGSGKTLCFQLPAMLKPGTAIVLSPLKALMVDHVVALTRAHVPATYVNGDLAPDEKELRYTMLEQGGLKLLYCAPERFNRARVRPEEVDRLDRVRPSYLVVDEAHCIDRWGDDFRPDYGKLNEVRQRLGNPPVLAFTATAGQAMQGRIVQSLGIPEARIFVADINRPNIALVRATAQSSEERLRIAANLIRAAHGKVMIFVPTRNVGQDVRDGLQQHGLEIPFYHGKLSPAERDMLLSRYTGRIEPGADAIICTNAFGMGLDIANVRIVIHWVQPASVEDYMQEFGRAGRDGKPAYAVIFKERNDLDVLEFMARKTVEQAINDHTSAQEMLEAKYQRIRDLDRMIRSRTCFRRQLLAYMVGDTPQRRRSLALRIADMIFVQRHQQASATFCCDACDGPRAQQLLARLSA